MTPQQTGPHVARHRVPPEYTPRLRLKPRTDTARYVDGAWWPRSRDLAAELPDVLAVLQIRLGPVWRVVYDPDGWSPAPGRMTVNGYRIRLDAYTFELFNTMYVWGADGAVLVLRVIPSATDADLAHSAMMATARRTEPGARPRSRS